MFVERRAMLAGRAPGRPKLARIPSGDRPVYPPGEGPHQRVASGSKVIVSPEGVTRNSVGW
jgi:hypothetical protein